VRRTLLFGNTKTDSGRDRFFCIEKMRGGMERLVCRIISSGSIILRKLNRKYVNICQILHSIGIFAS